MPYFEGTVTLSGHLDYFEHQGVYYVYHNLFGYILQMSEDILGLLEFFRGERRDVDAVEAAYSAHFGQVHLENFLKVLFNQGCIVPEGASEEEVALKMIPVHARWTIYEQPDEGSVTLYRARRDEDKVDEIVLDAWDSALWRLVDDERTMDEIVELLRDHPESPSMGLEQKALATLSTLTHCGAQFLKLSPRPMSAFRADVSRRGVPPYLMSTMPYKRVTEEIRGEVTPRVTLDADETDIGDSALARDQVETTMGHLFRVPHEALRGRTFGGTLLDRARLNGALDEGARVLEVGAATAGNAIGLAERWRELEPARADGLELTLVLPSEVLAAACRAALEEAGVSATVFVGDADGLDKIEGLGEHFDFIYTDEHIAGLKTVLMRKLPPVEEEEEGADASDGESPTNGKARQTRDLFMGEGQGVNLIFKHNLTFHDVDAGEFFLNEGAVHFVEQAAARLAPGGLLTIIEDGDLFAYPKLTSGEGRLNFSIHFRILQQAGRSLGLECEFDWLLSAFEMDTNTEMLATTKTSFRALRSLLAKGGVELENIAYSRAMFDALLEGHIAPHTVQGIEFSSLNDRAMGIVPSSVKIMEMRRAKEGQA